MCWACEMACPLLEAHPELREELRERVRKRRVEATMAKWAQQASELRKEYPSFTLTQALKDERFCALLVQCGDVRQAHMKYKEG